MRLILVTKVAFLVIFLAFVYFETSNAIAIRPFKHRTLVNGVNCSTETAFAAFGCYCRLNGQKCLGNLRCINNNCSCPTGGSFLTGSGGQCIPNWWISINCSNPLATFGFTNCLPAAQTNIPNLILNGNKPMSCQTQNIKTFTIPTDTTVYDDPSLINLIAVDPNTGQVYYTAGIPQFPAPGISVCGPGASNPNGQNPLVNANPPPNFLGEPLIETYQIQCIDARGITSGNILTVNITFPPCDINQVCNADGSCCSSPPVAG